MMFGPSPGFVPSPAEQHLRATLRPSPETIAKMVGRLAADSHAGAGYSVLAISSPTNSDISFCWVGDETVFDPGEVFATREEAWWACEQLASEGAQGTAYVVHYAEPGSWVVFINH